MADVINRLTKEIRRSVNTPEFQEPKWMAINGLILPECPIKWWVIEASGIREMTQLEKDELAYSTESTIYLITEKQLLTRKNGNEYEDNTDAIINPVMPGCDLKYTKVMDGLIVEMTVEEKAVVDAPEIEKSLSITDIKEAYLTALDNLDNIINAENPTNAQVIAAIKTEARILKKMLKFIRLNTVQNI